MPGTMSKEMSCSKSLSLGVKRAFICQQCYSEAEIILCEDCATFCHPFHSILEVILVKDQSLSCDCGNARDVNRICLLDSDKPDFNVENIYLFTCMKIPKFNLEDYTRRCELLSKSGKIYINRAIALAAKSCYLASMDDISTAIAWDREAVESWILNISDVYSFGELIRETRDKFLLLIQSMDYMLMPSAELVKRFCNRVRSTCNKLRLKTRNSDLDLEYLNDCLGVAQDLIMQRFWARALTLDYIIFTSKRQFLMYKQYVAPDLPDRVPFFSLDFTFFDWAEELEFRKEIGNHLMMHAGI